MIYQDAAGLYVCRLCMFHGEGDRCYHLPPMMREHNRRVKRRLRALTAGDAAADSGFPEEGASCL
jgi:hypothetical protein